MVLVFDTVIFSFLKNTLMWNGSFSVKGMEVKSYRSLTFLRES